MKKLQTPDNGETNLQNPNDGCETDFDSACSTPYVSAPSSPGRATGTCTGGVGFFYSAPTSPMHYLLSTSSFTPTTSSSPPPPENSLEDFDFSASWYSNDSTTRPMSSADELFLNGQIRPMKLSTHLEENESGEEEKIGRGRTEIKLRNRSLRRARSMSPLRSLDVTVEKTDDDAAAAPSGSSSRSSSLGRNSKRWVFLKEFLYRSKSEGRNNGRHKYFWSSKDKKMAAPATPPVSSPAASGEGDNAVKRERRKGAAGEGKRRVGLSAHEMHYTANRAVAEEMRRKTFLPYRQGLFGCLGFNSKGYGAMNGFARALNPVSSR